jgi:hypothetical protein
VIEAYRTSLTKKEARKLGMRVRKDEGYLVKVIEIIEMQQYPESAKAAWVLRTASDARPSLMGKRVAEVLYLIESSKFSGARRDLIKCIMNLVKMKSYSFKDEEGSVLDMCFERLTDADSATAEKYYTLQMLGRFAKTYPEIIPEIISSAEMQLDHGTDSFKRMAIKLIAKLEEMQLKEK